jgi:hypothetical protein
LICDFSAAFSKAFPKKLKLLLQDAIILFLMKIKARNLLSGRVLCDGGDAEEEADVVDVGRRNDERLSGAASRLGRGHVRLQNKPSQHAQAVWLQQLVVIHQTLCTYKISFIDCSRKYNIFFF